MNPVLLGIPPLLALPSLVPLQVMFVAAFIVHVVAVLLLTVRRGHPAWLGLAFGFLPLVGIGLALMMPEPSPAVLREDRSPAVRRWASRGDSVLGVLVVRAVLVLAILVVAVAIFEVPNLRFDMTSQRLYSLDPLTRDVLARIDGHDETLQIEYFYSPSSLRPPRFGTLPTEIEEMLEEYRAYSSKVVFRMVEVPQQSSGDASAGGRPGSVLDPMSLSPAGEKTPEAIEREEAKMTDAELERARVLRRVEQLGFKPIVEDIVEGNRKQTVNFYSGFNITYGAAGSERIDGVTVTRDEADAGKRPVDHANYLLTTTIMQLVDRAIDSPAEIRMFSLDGARVKLVGIAGSFGQGDTFTNAAGESYRVNAINAEARLISVVRQAGASTDSPNLPIQIRQTARTRITVGFLDGHGELHSEGESVKRLMEQTGRITTETVDLQKGATPVPEHIDVLVVTPTVAELTQREQYEIDQFIMYGGRVLFTYGLLMPPTQRTQYGFSLWDDPHKSWGEFISAMGVRVGENLVFDERCLILPRGNMRVVATSVLQIMPGNLASHPVTAGLLPSEEQISANSIYLAYTTSVADNGKQPGAAFAPILHSTDQAWETPPVNEIKSGPFQWWPDSMNGPGLLRVMMTRPDTRAQYTVAAAKDGAFTSAFSGRAIPPIPAVGENALPPGFQFPGMPGSTGSGDSPDNQGTPDTIEPGTPIPAPAPAPTPARDRLDQSAWPSRFVIFGTNMTYPISIGGANTDELLVNAVEYLAGGDRVLHLRAKTTARHPIDPTLTEDSKNWLGWLVSLLVPVALALVSLLVVVFGLQERFFFRVRAQAKRMHESTVALPIADAPPADRGAGAMALIVGVMLLGALVAVWIFRPTFAGLWLVFSLLALALLGVGAKRLLER